MRATPHTNIKGIGTYRIYAKHVFFEAGIVGTDIPRINLPLHLVIQHGIEIIPTRIKGFSQLWRVLECRVVLDGPVDILESIAP